ncbi:WhiB family transcriptional regulator [Streptomyces sp. NPDC048362]|uniref:WhiB family transcriptional regulator n=1 Tax=Streptomyces sp. NPDC048362 TaxID=3365539 RepID=UPI00371DC3FF
MPAGAPRWQAASRREDGNGVFRDDDDAWREWAACRATDPDALFVPGAAQNSAKAVCDGCIVRTECLSAALDNRIEHGIWGGMTERERRALLRRRPTVTSWRRLLESARAEHEQQANAGSTVGNLSG